MAFHVVNSCLGWLDDEEKWKTAYPAGMSGAFAISIFGIAVTFSCSPGYGDGKCNPSVYWWAAVFVLTPWVCCALGFAVFLMHYFVWGMPA